MKNKFVTGVLTGAACALIAAALLFVVYFAGLPTNEAEASERYEQEITVTPNGEAQGVFSVSDDVMLEKLEYIKKMIADYSLNIGDIAFRGVTDYCIFESCHSIAVPCHFFNCSIFFFI